MLPDLPTALEAGSAGVDADGWNAFFFPKDTPDAIVQRVTQATGADPRHPRRARAHRGPRPGHPAAGASAAPDYLAKLVASELDKWGPPIKAAGISVD